jgi:hypothetical protein
MRSAAAAALLLVGLFVAPADAQGRRHDRGQGIPPGHLPPAGECRVWYDGVPPGQQPPPTSCREAERIASRDRRARVIYGDSRDRDAGWWGRDDRRSDRPRAVPRRSPGRYPDRDPYPGDGRYPYPDSRGTYGRYASVPYENGYDDGVDKGREDARDRDDYDPVRHGRYRSADRGYEREYGSKEAFKDEYREGFRAGYDAGYREGRYDEGDRRDGGFRWPF